MASEESYLHSSSRSSLSNDVCRSSKCKLTMTSVDPTQEMVASRLLPQPDPRRDESSWCELFSLESLRLTLPQIAEDCRLHHKANPLEEFPVSKHFSVLDSSVKQPLEASPSRPKAHIDLDKLLQKRRYLKLLTKFYMKRIHWLSTDSRQLFGLLGGKRVAILAEDSSKLGEINEGKAMNMYQECLKQFVDEQLLEKETVYLVKFGSQANPREPQPLPFLTSRTQCNALAKQWIAKFQRKGSCNLLDALRTALNIQPSVDTVCVIQHTQPDQDISLIRDFLVDSLTGESSPRLHIVSLHCLSDSLRSSLADMATATHAHFHSIARSGGEAVDGEKDSESEYLVEDSEVTRIRQEIDRARAILANIEQLRFGNLEHSVVDVLRELSLATDWTEDDDFPNQPPPPGVHCLRCDSAHWLPTHGVAGSGLSLYKFLAPNAYPQLSGHVEIVDRMAVSHVYDVMPVFTWHDGSTVYLHIDVDAFNQYIQTLTAYIADTLQPRLQWLLSGSNMPFSTLTESRMVLVLDNSYPVLAQILTLQQHVRMLLEEQLTHVQGFNMIRFGKECSCLADEFCQPTRETLMQAWEWTLGMSPSGTCDLLSALRLIFESETLLANSDKDLDETAGVYLVVTSMPDQCLESVCSYVEQQVSGRHLSVNVIYYNMEFQTGGMVVPGREGGRYGCEEEVEECLRAIAKSGGGRFHHFKVSGSSEGDDVALLLGEISQAQSYLSIAEKILSDYREFCKRNVPPPPPLVSSDKSPERRHPPPTYPRQTAASLARLNTNARKMASLRSSPLSKPQRRSGRKQIIKTQSFYTGLGNQKAVSWDIQSRSSKSKRRPLIPSKEVYISSEEWLSRYSLQKLDLTFNKLLPPNSSPQSRRGTPVSKTLHKHINKQGEMVDLRVSHPELKIYITELQSVLSRYQSRLQWLHRDCHRQLGVVVETEVVWLLDVSSSMKPHLDSMKCGLTNTLRECPPKLKSFNIMAFSSQVDKWCDQLVPVTQDSVTEALHWIQGLKAGGGSCLLEAIKVSLDSGAQGVYLVTDGAANHTQEFLLSQLPVLRRTYGERWKLNTVTFDSAEKDAQSFLKQLAHSTNGRFHISLTHTPAPYNHSPVGDDVSLLCSEIKKAQNSFLQAKKLL